MIKLLVAIMAIHAFNTTDLTTVGGLVDEPLSGDKSFERDQIVNMDFSLPTIMHLWENMDFGATWTVHLKDESRFTLTKTAEIPESGDNERVPAKLYLKVFIFSPGDVKPKGDPAEGLHLAFSSVYEWNDLANSLVPKECNEDFKTVSVVEHECEKAMHTANEILQLQLTGNVQQTEFTDLGLEECIRSKIQLEALINHPYMKCIIRILGEPKYKDALIDELIKEKEKAGYTCNKLGECIMPEDPEILAALMENLSKQLEGQEPVPVRVPFDDRERYCREDQITVAPTADSFTQYSYNTYEYGCDHWVNRIYFYMDGGFKLKWATEYVSYKADENGNHVFVSKEVQYTSRFLLPEAEFVEVDWKNGERIRSITLWQTNDSMKVVYRIELSLSTKDGTPRKYEFGLPMEGPMLTNNTPVTYPINGEIVGWNVTNISMGTVVNAIDVKV